MLENLFKPSKEQSAARALLSRLSGEARRPALYLEGGVADTVDGRFDLLVVYLILALRRLKAEGPAGQDMGQRLLDTAFGNFDEALREMGVGDLTVPKRIRKMAEAFYGRLEAYETALAEPSGEAFRDALRRNLYRGVEPTAEQVAAVERDLRAFADRLAAAPSQRLLQGELP